MPKSIDSNLNSEKDNQESEFRYLLELLLDEGTVYLCQGDTGNITFDGNEYEAVDLSIGEIEESSDKSETEKQVSISVSDPRAEIAYFVAVLGDTITGKGAVLKLVSVNYLDSASSYETLVSGVINNIQFVAGKYKFDIVANANLGNNEAPYKTYQAHCQHIFKSTFCGYTGTETICDKQLTTCQGYNNIENFDGTPSSAEE